MRTKATNEVTLTFPSLSRNESFVRSATACFAAQLDPTLNELEDIKTAVSEAVTNAIVHGYPDSIGQVTVKLRVCGENQMEVVVKDHAGAFLTLTVPGSQCLQPVERSAAAWALRLWRALWTRWQSVPR